MIASRLDAREATLAPTARGSVGAEASGRHIDRFELVLLATFAGVSAWVLGLDLWQVVVHGRSWTGTDGLYLVDQMQYLAWIRDASHHSFASNLFVLRATPHDYLMPAVAISGGISAFGVAPWLSLLLWKPVAVAGTFWSVRAYGARSLVGLWPRRAALVLGLFFGSFSLIYGSFGVLDDLFPGFQAWGYPFGLMALAAMVAGLLAYSRARAENRLAWTPGLLGALASWLHPWQGELLILILIGSELMLWRRQDGWRRRLALTLVTLGITAVPLAYYAVLARSDGSWRLARAAGSHTFSFLAIALAIAPLALPAAFAYRWQPQTLIAAATRTWPIAALGLYELSQTGLGVTPLHAFEGITIPLAILAVQAVSQLRWERLRYRRQIATLAIAAATIPATAYALNFARGDVAPAAENANFITNDERRALDYLGSDRDPGGVLTRAYLGSVLPGITGRRTFVGTCVWSTPRCSSRATLAQQLLGGSLGPAAARRFVVNSGARFVLADCSSHLNLAQALRPLLVSVHRFGCATVYTVG